MSLWRTARGEVAGAWRSLQYDLRRRTEAEPRSGTELYDPEDLWNDDHDDEYDRPPRRLVAVTAFGLLALVGAAGSYFAVVNGLGMLLTDDRVAGTLPLAADAGPAPVSTGRQAATSRLGYGTAIVPEAEPQPVPRRTKRSPAPEASPEPVSAPVTTPARTVAPTPTPCRCSPPVPTPTFPRGTPHSGYPSGSASASPSTSASSSPSATPGGSTDDGAEDDPRDPPRGHVGY
jgi:hypothetical protein